MSGLPPAGWHPDPTGRHRLRYWDGAQWTEHISDAGETGTDPLPGAAAPVEEEAVAPVTAEPATPGLGAPPPSVPVVGVAPLPSGPTYGTTPTAAGAPPTTMRSIGGLAASLTVLLWITVAVAIFGAFAFANRATVANDILDFDGRSFADLLDLQQRADDADDLVGIAFLLMLLCSLAIFVLLVIWMWRVAKNAELAGRTNPRFGPGWTIGSWFVPLANLVLPVLVMQDLWRASAPDRPRGDADWRKASGSALVGWWWAAYLVSTLRFFSGGEADTRTELETLRTTDTLAAVGSVVTVAAAILLIRVVRGLTRRQEALLAGDAAGPV